MRTSLECMRVDAGWGRPRPRWKIWLDGTPDGLRLSTLRGTGMFIAFQEGAVGDLQHE
jgi:hypothetical protein